MKFLKETFNRIENLHDRQNRLTGLATGFYDLDDMTCGLQPSELIIVAARPSMGKTSLALNIIEHVGVVEKSPSSYFPGNVGTSGCPKHALFPCQD